jgi:decaprenylphospho-beta-D-ribofuranose 2-oxidase
MTSTTPSTKRSARGPDDERRSEQAGSGEGRAAPWLAYEPQTVAGWGMAVRGPARVARPETEEQVADAFRAMARAPRSGSEPLVALRGSGCSYGDASMNTGGRVLDMTGMRAIRSFDKESGVAVVEPGVRVRDLWRYSIEHGYWPPVVSGTMQVSMGGALSMNIHGKNAFQVGGFGDHVKRFRLVTPTGDVLECSREQNAEVFHHAIGGFGMLGCVTEIELKLKRVHSGRMKVWGIVAKDLDHNFELIESMRHEADYLVGWVDLHARGRSLGRGLLHRGDQYEPGEDPAGERLMKAELQDVPETLFGVVPKGWIWPGMWCAVKAGLTGYVNWAKFLAGAGEEKRSPYPQTHGAFHFLLDYVPRWQWAFKPAGLIQFQPFLPAAVAPRVLRECIEDCQRAGLVPYLGVLKRHRPDPFPMSHALDGYSMAMDFAVPWTSGGRDKLWRLTHRLADRVLENGGRFYYAKDATLLASSFERIHGAEAVAGFRALKQKLDPQGLLSTDLSRRMGV